MADIFAGLDLGYANVKGFGNDGPFVFPSLIGTPDHSRFKLGETGTIAVTVDGSQYFIGRGAIEQSRFTTRREERGWISTIEYKALFHAALSEMSHFPKSSIVLVTGLPVAFYMHDKDELIKILEGKHTIKRHERDAQVFDVEKVHVIPQGMGVVLDVALDEKGEIVNADVATGSVGIIDIGGKTTNILHARQMGDVAPETDSLDIGAWDAVRALHDPIQIICPDANYSDHEISNAIVAGYLRYKGEKIAIDETVTKTLQPMAREIVSRAMQLWPGNGAKLDSIILAGGGAAIMSDAVSDLIDHANITVVDDPMFANARGYYKLAMRAKSKK